MCALRTVATSTVDCPRCLSFRRCTIKTQTNEDHYVRIITVGSNNMHNIMSLNMNNMDSSVLSFVILHLKSSNFSVV